MGSNWTLFLFGEFPRPAKGNWKFGLLIEMRCFGVDALNIKLVLLKWKKLKYGSDHQSGLKHMKME